MLLFSLILQMPSTKELLTVLGAHTELLVCYPQPACDGYLTDIRDSANELSLYAIFVQHILLFVGIGGRALTQRYTPKCTLSLSQKVCPNSQHIVAFNPTI